MSKEIKWPKACDEIERVYFSFGRESVAAKLYCTTVYNCNVKSS